MRDPLKVALAGIVVAFVLLFVLTTFVPPPAAQYEAARQYFTDADIARGEAYSFGRKLFMWACTALELGLLIGLVATGAARRLADTFGRWVDYRPDAPPVEGSRWQRLRAWAGDLARWLV